ncbi:MAG TPA: hypothetical protein VFY96_01650 [Candidatus Binatia bacterium]|nr:hypothetical protein [Candidatus Binatia bacterium]
MAPVLVVTIVVVPLVVLVYYFYLPADLTTRRQVRVYVRVGRTRPDSPDYLREVTGSKLLRGHAPGNDICGRNLPSDDRVSLFPRRTLT